MVLENDHLLKEYNEHSIYNEYRYEYRSKNHRDWSLMIRCKNISDDRLEFILMDFRQLLELV